MLSAAIDVAILLIAAFASYGLARLSARSEIAALSRRLDGLDKSNLKAHVIAAAAVRAAERAEATATEARDLADNIPAAPPPSSRRPASTPTPSAIADASEDPAPASVP